MFLTGNRCCRIIWPLPSFDAVVSDTVAVVAKIRRCGVRNISTAHYLGLLFHVTDMSFVAGSARPTVWLLYSHADLIIAAATYGM